MVYLLLNIVFTVAFLVVFRLFPRFRVDNFQAIVFNYLVCMLTGLWFVDLDMLQGTLSWHMPWLPFAFLLGILFISIFYLIALTSQPRGLDRGLGVQQDLFGHPGSGFPFLSPDQPGF